MKKENTVLIDEELTKTSTLYEKMVLCEKDYYDLDISSIDIVESLIVLDLLRYLRNDWYLLSKSVDPNDMLTFTLIRKKNEKD